MTAPIAMAIPAPAESAQPQAMPQADGDDGGFGATLGAALAAQAGQLAPIVPEPVAAEPLLDLLTDGQWQPDLPAETDAEPVADNATQAPAEGAHDVPVVPLEKSLANWFATIGRRGQAERPLVPTSDDPAEVDLDAEAPDAAPADSAAVSTTDTPPADGAVLVLFAATGPVNPTASETRATAATTTDTLADRSDAGTSDDQAAGPRLSAPEAPRVGAEPRRPAAELPNRHEGPRQPVVEIAGFSFPDPAAGGKDRGADAQPEQQAPEWVARVRDLKTSGDDGEMARDAVRRATATAARPGEGGPKAAAEVRPAAPAPREAARPRREVAAVAESPAPRVEHRSGDGVPRVAPVTAGANRPLVDTTAGPAVEQAAPVALDPGERMARRVDSLMLDLKDDQGDYGRLKVSVSGTNVRATIMPNDQSMADRLNVEIRQLHQSLTERGFPEPKVTVQNPPAVADQPRWNPFAREEVAGASASEHSQPGRGGPDDERRERWTGTREQQQQRRDQGRTSDQPRQRKQDPNRRDA